MIPTSSFLSTVLPRLFAAVATLTTASAAPNLVPTAPSTAPNYWCTWYAQNYWIGRGTDLKDTSIMTNPGAREELNEHTVFNPVDGWATTYLPNSRQDFIFLIDHGWQTKDKSKRIAGGPDFFNLVIEEKDFPRYAGLQPGEVLRRFNEDIKALGWRELGIWTRGNITPQQAETFVKWSKEGGVRYWKIDGGDISKFYSTQAKERIFPELVLEYITGSGGNINPKWDQDLNAYPSVYDIGGRLQFPMLRCLQNSDTFRTYDASPLLMSVTTLRRTHDILRQTQGQSKYRAILNVQDDCNLAIGLGVLVSSKRHPNYDERTFKGEDIHHQLSGPRRMQSRIDEVGRFGRWSRIAPAFPAGEGSYRASEIELVDRCNFTEYDTWAQQTYGKLVSQSAPSAVSRNMPLPVVEVDEGELLPFVAATTYPNGPTGIATEGRVTPEKRWVEPRAKVTVQIKDATQPIGVVGRYRELVLRFAGSLEAVKNVWAQDLLADQATDIKSEVTIDGDTLTLSGELIDRIGTAAATPGDLSVPGLVLKLEGEALPLAGEDFTPEAIPATIGTRIVYQGGPRPQPKVTKKGNSVLVQATGPFQVGGLKPLPETLTTGIHSFTWTMSPASESGKQNGFLVLSSDENALSSIIAGTWTGSGKMAVFQGRDDWTKAATKVFTAEDVIRAELTIDLDRREAVLKIGNITQKLPFDESFTSISHVGYGVHLAETRFSIPVIR